MPDLFQLATVQLAPPAHATLTPAEANHCLRVLRHQVGDVIAGTDGQGLYVEGPIVQASRESVTLQVTHHQWNRHEPPAPTYLLIAPPKVRDRLEWLVEKAVELGCTHLWLVETQRTERTHANLERLTGLLWAALKQCQRSRLPELRLLSYAQALAECPADVRQIALVGADVPLQPVAASASAAYLIGPEGDFTPAEVEAARAAGWQTVHLGTTRLRTETAGMYVLAVRKAVN